jgi:hypothetical protein
METQNIFPLHAQPKAQFRARIVSVFDDTRGHFKRHNKRAILGNVVQAGRQVYFPSTDYKNSSPEQVEITIPKNITEAILSRCIEDVSYAAAMIGGALVPKEEICIEFVADVVCRSTESVSENGNWFNYTETALIRPRNARII